MGTRSLNEWLKEVTKDGRSFINRKGFRVIIVDGKNVRLDRYRVEKAMGKPLRERAIIHHWTGNKLDDRNKSIVVCQSPQYRRLLKERTRELFGSTKLYRLTRHFVENYRKGKALPPLTQWEKFPQWE